jgi:hypothetical protein
MSLVSVITAVVLLGVTTGGLIQYSNSLGQHRREVNTRVREDSYRIFQQELALSGSNPNGMAANPLADAVTGIAGAPTPTIDLVNEAGRSLAGSADVRGFAASSDRSGRAGSLGYRISSTGTPVTPPAATALTAPTFRVLGVIPENEFAPLLTNLIVPAAGNPSGTVYRYTTDGSDPTASSPVWIANVTGLPADPLPATVKAAAFNSDPQYSASNVITATLSRSLGLTYGRSGGGTSTSFAYAEVTGATNTIQLTVANAPAGTQIYYTYDGSAPSVASPLYTGGFHVPLAAWGSSVTLRAIAASGASNVAFTPLTATLTPTQAVLPAPSFGVQGGTPSAISVPVASAVAGVVIRYELDATITGSSPTVASGGSITVVAP